MLREIDFLQNNCWLIRLYRRYWD